MTNQEFFNAVKNGNLQVVQEFIDDGFDVTIKSEEQSTLGMTALMIAANNSNYRLANILIKANSTMEHLFMQQDYWGTTALIHAAGFLNNNVDIVNALLEHATYDHIALKDRNGMTALMTGASFGTPEIATSILNVAGDRAGEYLAIKDLDGNTAFGKVAHRGHIEFAKVLLEKGSCEQLALQNNSGMTPLMIAAVNNRIEIVEAFTEKSKMESEDGIILMQDNYKRTALTIAAERGYVELTNILLNANSSQEHLSVLDRKGNNALMLATNNNHKEVVKTLLKFGAIVPDSVIVKVSELTGISVEVLELTSKKLLSFGELELQEYKDLIKNAVLNLKHDSDAKMSNVKLSSLDEVSFSFDYEGSAKFHAILSIINNNVKLAEKDFLEFKQNNPIDAMLIAKYEEFFGSHETSVMLSLMSNVSSLYEEVPEPLLDGQVPVEPEIELAGNYDPAELPA